MNLSEASRWWRQPWRHYRLESSPSGWWKWRSAFSGSSASLQIVQLSRIKCLCYSKKIQFSKRIKVTAKWRSVHLSEEKTISTAKLTKQSRHDDVTKSTSGWRYFCVETVNFSGVSTWFSEKMLTTTRVQQQSGVRRVRASLEFVTWLRLLLFYPDHVDIAAVHVRVRCVACDGRDRTCPCAQRSIRSDLIATRYDTTLATLEWQPGTDRIWISCTI